MHIVADEHIPYVREAFASIGDVSTCPGRNISTEMIADADVLIVRSITPVSPALLHNTKVRCVGTATSGMEHIDLAALERAGIGVVHAQGANAKSVAEYVLAAILEVTQHDAKPITDFSCGIVGFGHVGSTLYTVLTSLGLRCCVYDPFLDGSVSEIPFCDWETIARQDIITLHTPLTHDGSYPTFHFVDDTFMQQISEDAILINSARGGVVDGEALLHAKQSKPGLRIILDVWEGEPDISLDLLACTDIATAHIAGYSREAKVEATRRVYRGVCAYFGLSPSWEGPLDAQAPRIVPRNLKSLSIPELCRHVRQAYPIRVDDEALRRGLHLESGTIAEYFDTLRNSYAPRREYSIRL